MELVNIFQHV